MPNAVGGRTAPNSEARAVLRRQVVLAAGGVRLSVLIATPGAGVPTAAGLPTVVALHGFASSAASGWGRTGHLDALTRAGRTVVAPDLRAHGHSDKPYSAAAYTLPGVLDDIARCVRSLVPTAGAAGEVGVGGAADADAAGGIDLIGYSLGSRLAFTIARRGLLPVRRMVLGGFDGRPLFDGVDHERLDRLAAGVATNDRAALRALVAGLAGTGAAAEDEPLPDVPTLVVAGDRDPLAVRAQAFVATLPHGEFLSIPGRDHISTVPSRDYRRRLVEFLAE